jgi:hypothetical protein
MKTYKFIFLKILLMTMAMNCFAQTHDPVEKPIEKEKLDFGEAIKESTKEVKDAASDFNKTVKSKKYAPRKSKGKKNVKLNIPKETVLAEDNIQWDHNRKEALKQKKKLDDLTNVEADPGK